MSILKYMLGRELGKVLSMRQPHRLRFFLNQFHVWVSHLTSLRTSSFSLFSFFSFVFFRNTQQYWWVDPWVQRLGWNAPCLLPSFAPESCELLMPIGRKDGTWDSFSRQGYHNGGWVQLQPHPGIHALQHQPEQIPAATCTYVSITHELKKISHQETRNKIWNSLMTSAQENKRCMIPQTDGYLWFQVQLRGILHVGVTLNFSRVCTFDYNLAWDLQSLWGLPSFCV